MHDLATVTIEALRAAFPDRDMAMGDAPDVIVVFPAAHPAVGSVEISEDGGELIVAIENITHGHFACYDDVSDAEKAARTVRSVVEFLQDLFADRVVLWRAFGSAAGGWNYLEPGETAPRSGRFKEVFLWSGPVPRN